MAIRPNRSVAIDAGVRWVANAVAGETAPYTPVQHLPDRDENDAEP